jgi:hypothetical protein
MGNFVQTRCVGSTGFGAEARFSSIVVVGPLPCKSFYRQLFIFHVFNRPACVCGHIYWWRKETGISIQRCLLLRELRDLVTTHRVSVSIDMNGV